ncbi:MAG: hypothetical protein KAW61_02735 [candidate division Zixibacteria bacterium]|nr:hypothetical protein [candidate division Zixibacteria bacterium]
MRPIICHLLMALLAAQLHADNLVRPADEIRLPLPEGWVAGGGVTGFPIQLVNQDLTAELQIFRSEIPEEDAITDGEQLCRAVDDIIDDVILSLPEAQLHTNTGYQEDNRAWFVLEFSSVDTMTFESIHHRMTAVLYRHPDGHQLLFTLWGKASTMAPTSVQADFRTMQNGFGYTGPVQRAVFAEPGGFRWWLLGAVMVVLLLVLRLRRRGARESD